MAMSTEVFVCEICGYIIEVLESAGGTLVCCGQDMSPQKENSTDAATEKHVPVVTIEGTTATVQVGSTSHPMEEQHHIAWIELQQGNKLQRIHLQPGDAPQAIFTIESGVPVAVREWCNLHGLWRT